MQRIVKSRNFCGSGTSLSLDELFISGDPKVKCAYANELRRLFPECPQNNNWHSNYQEVASDSSSQSSDFSENLKSGVNPETTVPRPRAIKKSNYDDTPVPKTPETEVVSPRNLRKPMMFCSFCKKNGEPPKFYRSHIVRDRNNITRCPILRNYECPICHNPGGDNGHTVRYCPRNEFPNGESPIVSLEKTVRKSTGPRHVFPYKYQEDM